MIGSFIDNAPAHASRLMQSFSVKHQITQVTQPSYSPDLGPWDFWLFPKLKSPLKGKRFETVDEIQENRMGQLMAIGRTVWGPKVPTLKGSEVSLSYKQCFSYLVSSSINVYVFPITWLSTFWTDLIKLAEFIGRYNMGNKRKVGIKDEFFLFLAWAINWNLATFIKVGKLVNIKEQVWWSFRLSLLTPRQAILSTRAIDKLSIFVGTAFYKLKKSVPF